MVAELKGLSDSIPTPAVGIKGLKYVDAESLKNKLLKFQRPLWA